MEQVGRLGLALRREAKVQREVLRTEQQTGDPRLGRERWRSEQPARRLDRDEKRDRGDARLALAGLEGRHRGAQIIGGVDLREHHAVESGSDDGVEVGHEVVRVRGVDPDVASGAGHRRPRLEKRGEARPAAGSLRVRHAVLEVEDRHVQLRGAERAVDHPLLVARNEHERSQRRPRWLGQ